MMMNFASKVFGFAVLVGSGVCNGFVQDSLSGLNLESLVLEPLDGLRRSVESARVIQFVEMLVKFVAEGAASGLNVIAVYVSEILRVTGVNETVSIPHFTAEGVSAVITWALLALIGYWILFVVLWVIVALVRRVFWLLKVIVVLWLFVRIVSDPAASTDITTLRLILLVLICTAFGVATSSVAGTEAGLEKRVRNLEGRFRVMEKNKKTQ